MTSSQGAYIPQVLVYGGSLQYSMPYLKSEVKDLQLPDFINHLIPIVEAQLFTPVANNLGNSSITTGTINPGVIWVGSYFQVGLEAMIPINSASGNGIGVLGQLHLYLDDIFPTTVGQPLIGGDFQLLPASSPSKGAPHANLTFAHRIAAAFCAGNRGARAHTPFSIMRARSSAARCATAPHDVALTFTQNLEPAFSTVR